MQTWTMITDLTSGEAVSGEAVSDGRLEELMSQVRAYLREDSPEVQWVWSCTTGETGTFLDVFEAHDDEAAHRVAVASCAFLQAPAQVWLVSAWSPRGEEAAHRARPERARGRKGGATVEPDDGTS